MKVANALIWFDEDPADLRRLILSFSGLVDTLVAIDGAFEGYPSRSKTSPVEQALAIVDACDESGVELLMHWPVGQAPFAGEVPKRNASLRACGLVDPDWILVCDADMEIWSSLEAKIRIRRLLEETELDVALARIDGTADDSDARVLFRWSPDLWYDRAHWILRDAGRLLWGPLHPTNAAAAGLPPVEPALDLRWGRAALRLGHLEKTDGWRRSSQNAYYKVRDEQGIEAIRSSP